jgi:hypothetical protein
MTSDALPIFIRLFRYDWSERGKANGIKSHISGAMFGAGTMTGLRYTQAYNIDSYTPYVALLRTNGHSDGLAGLNSHVSSPPI